MGKKLIGTYLGYLRDSKKKVNKFVGDFIYWCNQLVLLMKHLSIAVFKPEFAQLIEDFTNVTDLSYIYKTNIGHRLMGIKSYNHL